MKVDISIEDGVLGISLKIRTIEEAGEAVEALKNAARIAWPNILFEGDPDFDEDKPKRRRKPGSVGTGNYVMKAIKPGSESEKVLETIKRIGSTDLHMVARALGREVGITSMAIGRLRRGGFLHDLEKRAAAA
jgi:hypothetical protein